MALFRRLVCTAALALPAFGAKGAVGLTTLDSFVNSSGGVAPDASLGLGSHGYFYGTTYYAGAYNAGTVFQMSSNGTLTTLHTFRGRNDGAYPSAALVQGSDGSFYGTTYAEGDTTNNYDPWDYGTPGWGTVFKLSTNGALTILYAFTGLADSGYPSGLIQGTDGYFYGTTLATVFQISSNGTFNTLGYPDGNLDAGLVQGSDGYFYGTTFNGGTKTAADPWGSGSVFKIATDGSLTTLYSFTGGNDGGEPDSALVQGGDGSFYGTTLYGGITNVSFTNGCGTVFKISTNGSLTTLHLFTGGKDGAGPNSALVQGGDGNLYGTTSGWGEVTPAHLYGYGTVYKIDTNGALTTLYSFNDGGNPSGLIACGDGSFFGTTLSPQETFEPGAPAGTVFRLTIAPDPELTLIPSEANMILAWPTNYGAFSYDGYNLQAATNLGPSAVWTAVSLSPVVIGGQYVVVNPVSGGQRFFRLRQ